MGLKIRFKRKEKKKNIHVCFWVLKSNKWNNKYYYNRNLKLTNCISYAKAFTLSRVNSIR